VASPHWAATASGGEVLENGGNAADAAFAVNAMLNVCYPHMCGLGGDLFLLFYEARTRTLHCLNGTGRAPALATAERYRALGYDAVPTRGALSITVPGAVEAWRVALERFGSQPVAELLEPAARAAELGVPITERLARWIAASAAEIRVDPTLFDWFFDEDGCPLEAGHTLRLPSVARTMRQLAERGLEDFYRGAIGEALAQACVDAGGLLRRDDLEHHRADWVAPISTSIDDVSVFTTPPNSQGIAALQMINTMAALDAIDLPAGEAEQIDALVRSKEAAFADRDRYITDPTFRHMPVTRLLSADYANAPRELVPANGGNGSLRGDTVYVCVLDGQGNACSLIQSIYYGFGSALVAGDTGVLLQNRGHYFSLDEKHPNCIRPRKRTLHTLMASMAFRKAEPFLVFGTMGADGQPQTTVQVLLRILTGSGAQDAVAAPRVLSGRFLLEDRNDRLYIEEDLGPETLAALERIGHDVAVVPPHDETMGHAHAILVRDGRQVEAGSDPRSDGSAIVLG
jgi:gamma-glutamyltranspeptidase/glutathione hydrolase